MTPRRSPQCAPRAARGTRGRRGRAAVARPPRSTAGPAVATRHVELYDAVLGDRQRRCASSSSTTPPCCRARSSRSPARSSGLGDRRRRPRDPRRPTGPLRARLEAAGAPSRCSRSPRQARTVHRDDVAPPRSRPRRCGAPPATSSRSRGGCACCAPTWCTPTRSRPRCTAALAARLAGVPCVWHVRDRLEPPAPAAARRAGSCDAAARLLPDGRRGEQRLDARDRRRRGRPRRAEPPRPLDHPRARPTDAARGTRAVRHPRAARPVEGPAPRDRGVRRRLPATAATCCASSVPPLFGEDDYAASLPALADDARRRATASSFTGFVEDVASRAREHRRADPRVARPRAVRPGRDRGDGRGLRRRRRGRGRSCRDRHRRRRRPRVPDGGPRRARRRAATPRRARRALRPRSGDGRRAHRRGLHARRARAAPARGVGGRASRGPRRAAQGVDVAERTATRPPSPS